MQVKACSSSPISLKLQIDYMKDAEKMKHDYNLPPDAPQFIQAKEAAENISDVSIFCFQNFVFEYYEFEQSRMLVISMNRAECFDVFPFLYVDKH